MNRMLRGLIYPLCAVVSFPVLANPNLPPPIDDSDYRTPASAEKIELGRLLFFDKIISGNQNISCATCHHPLLSTGAGVSLTAGEGGNGIGRARDTGVGSEAIDERIPRDAPPLFNLGAHEFVDLFRTGALMTDPSHPAGFRTPLDIFGFSTPQGLDSVLAMQAMFPPQGIREMTGQPGENAIANRLAADGGDPNGAWDLVAQRLRDIPDYVDLFIAAYPGKFNTEEDITLVDAANAIAAYEEAAYRADNTPFDQYLRGDLTALTQEQIDGMNLFYGSAGCSSCHSGKFLTDQAYHGVAMPQIGPGIDLDFDGAGDEIDIGRARATGNPADSFKFRTPPLRNIALTAPYGHAGAYATLEAVVRHYIDPVASLKNYDRKQAMLLPRADLDAQDFIVMDDPARLDEIAQSNDAAPVALSDDDVAKLVAFLHALTDPASIDLGATIPESVPSGLPLDPPADVCPTGCAHTSIAAALNAAPIGDEVTVANGIYNEKITLNNAKTLFSLGGAVVTTIDASGFNDTAATLIGGIFLSPNQFIAIGEAVLDGFTITGGYRNGDGGGLYVLSAGTVKNSSVRGNTATNFGGGLYSTDEADVTLDNNEFVGNVAKKGGAIYAPFGSYMTIDSSIFSGNHATIEGGALGVNNYATVNMSSSKLIKNTATNVGGAVVAYSSSNTTIHNTLIAKNSAFFGSGVSVNSQANFSLINTTITGNSAPSGGNPAESVQYGSNLSGVTMNTVIWGNTGGDIAVPKNKHNLPTIIYSNIGGGYNGIGNIDVDPWFVNPAIDDYHISVNSPLVDAGTDSGLLTDLDGKARPADGDGLGAGGTGDGSDYDIGAYERQ